MNVNLNNGKVFCTKCGTENKAGYRFCVKCGEKLMTPVPKPQPEDVQEFPKPQPEDVQEFPEPKPVKVEPKPAPQTFSAFEQATPVEEPVASEPAPQTFSAFEQATPVEEPVASEPALQAFNAFEQAALQEEPVASEPAPQSFSAFEQAALQEEPVASEPAPQSFSAFEQTSSDMQQLEPDAFMPAEPVKAEGFASVGQAAFEEEPSRQDTSFARSGFMGTTTPTAAAGAFATAVDAVKNDKKIDISDAETVMSLLEQGESSALAKGLPEWDIVPPQVVVRRKHRV